MSLSSNELARREGSRIEFASAPVRLRIGPISAACVDQHELRISLECSVMTRSQPADRQLFTELLFSTRNSVTKQDIASFLEPHLRSATASLCKQPVLETLSDDSRRALIDRIAKAMDAAAFAAGFVVLPPFQLEMDSPSLQQQQRDSAERSHLSERAANQLRQVKHASELLQQFEAFRAAAPHTPAGELLEQLAPPDRLAVFESTLTARAKELSPPTVIAVAGTSLVRIDFASSPPTTTLVPLPETLGPFRSVREVASGSDRFMLIGARIGIWLIDLDHPEHAEAYNDPTLQSTLGFNAAILLPNGTLAATHADGGLVTWQRGEGKAPHEMTRTSALVAEAATGPRSLQLLDKSRYAMAIGARLIVDGESNHAVISGVSPRPIVNLLPADGGLLVVHDDGAVGFLAADAATVVSRAYFGGSVTAAASLPWLGSDRILLSRDDGSIDCVGLNDSLITRLHTKYPGASRPLAASASIVVAGINDRQRLLAWQTPDWKTPSLDLHLPSLTKHRLADLAIMG